jgi:hypothetical protein
MKVSHVQIHVVVNQFIFFNFQSLSVSNQEKILLKN